MEGRKERGYERKDGKEGRVTEGEKEGKEREPAAPASPGNLLAVQILWPDPNN